MAQLAPGITFTGSLANLSAYKMRGSDKIILRTKGGASKRKIKRLPSFERTRELNAEFGGRATSTRWIRQAIRPLLPLADYNISGPLNALLKPIQDLDIKNEHGQRAILLSQQPSLLHGFQLNKRNPFDQIIRNPVTCTLSKDDCSAKIDLPSLLPGINFVVPGKFPFFSLTVVLGIIPDFVFHKYGYKTLGKYDFQFPAYKQTEWHLTTVGSTPQSIQLKIDKKIPDQSYSLIVSVGIRFGNPGVKEVEQIKHAGAAKILAVI